MSDAGTNIAKQSQYAAFIYNDADLSDPVTPLGEFGINIVQSLDKDKGGLSPVIIPNQQQLGEYVIAGTVRGAPSLGTATIMEKVNPRKRGLLEEIYEGDCDNTMLIKVDCDGRRDDLQSFESLYIVRSLRPNNLAHDSDIQSFTEDADTGVQFTSDAALIDWVRTFPINFASYAADVILAEIIDIIYADSASCGSCSPYSKGNEKIYALQKANSGSPGLSAQIVYTVDGRSTWNAVDLQALGGNDANRLTSVGSNIVVVSEFDGSHIVIPKNNISDTSEQVRVTSGYQVGGSPRVIVPLSTANVIIGGAGGYIYRSTDIESGVTVVSDASATTENCNDGDFFSNVVVTVHDSDTVLLSINSGATFAATDTTPEAGANLRSVSVISPTQWYIGTSTGKLWYTTDQGKTYTQRLLPRQDDISEVLDVKFNPSNRAVGALAVQFDDGSGSVYRTVTGGRTWFRDGSQAINNLPANERINVVSVYGVNEIAAGGKQSGKVDGVLAIALNE